MGQVIDVSGPIVVQHGWAGQRGYAYFFAFKHFIITSTFEPIEKLITPPMADAGCKVSWEIHNGVKSLIFIRFYGVSRLRTKIILGSPPGVLLGGRGPPL